MKSYDCNSLDSAKSLGSQLMDKPEIKLAIEDLMTHHGLSRSYRIGKLRNHVDNRDPNISLKALDMTWKLDGGYAPEKHVYAEYSIRDYVDYFQAKKEELERRLAQLDAGEDDKPD